MRAGFECVCFTALSVVKVNGEIILNIEFPWEDVTDGYKQTEKPWW